MSGTKEHQAWKGMKNRCYNPKYVHFKDYGGRGITVSDTWKNSFERFFKDMGPAPALKHTQCSVERMNVNGNYEKNNCRWALSQKEQMRNTRSSIRLTYLGKTKLLIEWAEDLKIPVHTLYARILEYGFSVKEALTRPVARRDWGIMPEHQTNIAPPITQQGKLPRLLKIGNKTKTIKEWSTESGLPSGLIYGRLYKGITGQELLQRRGYKK